MAALAGAIHPPRRDHRAGLSAPSARSCPRCRRRNSRRSMPAPSALMPNLSAAARIGRSCAPCPRSNSPTKSAPSSTGRRKSSAASRNDWQIRHERKEIPEDIWEFVKKHGFLGMLISKAHGGLGFSPQAQSIILGKIASRSPDVCDDRHGAELARTGRTDREVRHRRAEALLPAASRQGRGHALLLADRPDLGLRCRNHARYRHRRARHLEGQADVVGIKLSWDKRYITLGPDATLVGLAFRLFDPDNLLGETTEGARTSASPSR